MKKIKKGLIIFFACLLVFCAGGCELNFTNNTTLLPPSSDGEITVEEKEIVIVDEATDVARFSATTRSGVTPTISYKANYKGVNGVAEIKSKNAVSSEAQKYGGFVFLGLNESEALEVYNSYKADTTNFTLKLNLYVRVIDTVNIKDTKATLSGVFNNIRDFQMNEWQEFSVAGEDITGWTNADDAVKSLTGKKEFFYIQHAWESATISNTNVESDIYIYVDSITYSIPVKE